MVVRAILAGPVAAGREESPPLRALVKLTVRTSSARQPEIHLALSIPKVVIARSKEGGERGKPGAVVAFCTWESEASSLRAGVMNKKFGPVKFAMERGLPVLS